MMTFVLLAVFGSFAGFAFIATSKHDNLWLVGSAIVFNYFSCNLVTILQQHYLVTLDTRIITMTCVEMLVASIAFTARMTGASRLLVGVVALTALICCANLALLTYPHDDMIARYRWNLATNVCYIGKCLLVISAGLLERARQSRRDRGAHHARALVARDGFQR